MGTIRIEYPENIPAVLNLSPDEFEQEAKLSLAVKLYEMGRLRACAKITWQIELITVRPEVSKGSGGHSCFDTSA